VNDKWLDVRNELQRRRDVLVSRSHDDSSPMEPFERARIQPLLERWEAPPPPIDIPNVVKQFCVSAFSYAPLRNNFFKPLADGLPTRDNIARALSRAFDEARFLDNDNWLPAPLERLALAIQRKHKFDLSSRQFKPRVVGVLLTGSRKLGEELSGGLHGFYERIARVSDAASMWDLVNDFSKSIHLVGPALICDFFKEIGFVRYVKIDHHFGKQLPKLVNVDGNCRLNPKRSFLMSQEIADAVGMTPFHLDSILYLWGRYGDRKTGLN